MTIIAPFFVVPIYLDYCQEFDILFQIIACKINTHSSETVFVFCTKRINALQLIFGLIVKDSITEEGK